MKCAGSRSASNAALAARVPQLEAAPEPRESGVSASEGRPGTDPDRGSGEARFQLVVQALLLAVLLLAVGPYRAEPRLSTPRRQTVRTGAPGCIMAN
jgi:hypothetical protein